jgi:hypothetical protein
MHTQPRPTTVSKLKEPTLSDETTRQWDDPVFDPDSEPGRALEQELQQVLNGIGAAADIDGLLLSARQIQALVHRLVEQATDAEPMTLLISMLNDVLTRRVAERRADAARGRNRQHRL